MKKINWWFVISTAAICVVWIGIVLVISGCGAKEPRHLDPNYVQYQQAFDSYLVAMTIPRPLVEMEGHEDRPITIDAKVFRVNQPAPDFPLPQQYRDFTAEATVQMWSNLGTAGIGMFGMLGQGVVGWLNHRETMGVMDRMARTGGGINLNASDQSSVHLHGGVGDRNWSGDESTFSESGSPDFVPVLQPSPTIVHPEVVVVQP